jgi:hypothetical protein
MLVTCWSVKGGSGTTVVAAALGLLLGGMSAAGSLLVDAGGGDLAAALGVHEGSGPGVTDWLASSTADPVALRRLETAVAPGVALLSAGSPGPFAVDRGAQLADALLADGRSVVVDAGVFDDHPLTVQLASASAVSLLVIRPCYLAMRRAIRVPLRPSGVVLVQERGRTLSREDVEEALGVPVRAEVNLLPSVARLVDAGLLATRLPRSLARSLREAA